MMGSRQVVQGALFYEFSIWVHVLANHLLQSIDRFVDFGDTRQHLAPFYSSTGRPSVDPELMIRMLIVLYAFGILGNLSSHNSPGAAKAMRDIGAWFLFLPPYSPDLNLIELAFSKLKALIRKAIARTYQEFWKALGHVCGLFTDEECYNFFKAAGYKND